MKHLIDTRWHMEDWAKYAIKREGDAVATVPFWLFETVRWQREHRIKRLYALCGLLAAALIAALVIR